MPSEAEEILQRIAENAESLPITEEPFGGGNKQAELPEILETYKERHHYAIIAAHATNRYASISLSTIDLSTKRFIMANQFLMKTVRKLTRRNTSPYDILRDAKEDEELAVALARATAGRSLNEMVLMPPKQMGMGMGQGGMYQQPFAASVDDNIGSPEHDRRSAISKGLSTER